VKHHCLVVIIILEEAASVWRLFLCDNSFAMSVLARNGHDPMSDLSPHLGGIAEVALLVLLATPLPKQWGGNRTSNEKRLMRADSMA
jgi:hypothetical protein